MKYQQSQKQMRDDITCVFQGVAGVGGIYISNIKAAKNLPLLHSLSIKAIVSAVRNGVVLHDKSQINDHLYIPADDSQAFDLSQYFQRTYNFIDNVRKKTNVLVHCYAGISRSATIVIAYLLRKYNYSLDRVISMVKRRRNKINPNKGFIQQLKQQAQRMGIISLDKDITVEQVLRKTSFSKENKKRPASSYLPRKIVNQKVNQQQNQLKNQKEITLADNKKTQPITQQLYIKNNKSITFYNQNQISKILEYQVNKQKKKEGKLLSEKYLEEIKDGGKQVNYCSQNTQNSLFNEKILKIQRLKSKILELQCKKKTTQKRSFSQLFTNQPQKQKQIIHKKCEGQHLYTILSKKLDYEKINKMEEPIRKRSLKQQKQLYLNKILFQQTSNVL